MINGTLYMNCELPDVQAGFRKGRGTRGQIANIRCIMEKAREFEKNIYFFFTCPLLCHSSKFYENILRSLHVFLFSQANKLVKYLLIKDQTQIPINHSDRVIPTLLPKLSFLLPSPLCHGSNHLVLWPLHSLTCPPLPFSHSVMAGISH